jgi:hypothetical protein
MGTRPRTAVAIRRGQGDAEGHGLLIDDVHEAGLPGRMAHRADDEPLAEERVGRIDNLDLLGLRWVLEVGIKAWVLSTRWIMLTYGSFSSGGYVTGCNYD